MKLVLLFLLSFIGLQSFAQKWSPPGAEWTIGWGGVWGYSGYHLISYEKDTVYMGQACKKLVGKGVDYNYINKVATNFNFNEPIYTYAQNDTVFIYYENEFRPVYFFNVEVGDTIHFGKIEGCNPPLIQVVDSVGSIIINNDTLRFYRVNQINYPWWLGSGSFTVVEKLGCLDSDFYPYIWCAVDIDAYALCSYKDYEINWHVSWTNDTCWAFTGTNDLFDQSLKITPNPAINNLNISSSFNEHIETVSIIDINGGLVKNLKQINGVDISNIDISYILNGIYIIQIQTSDGNRYIRKFVKLDYK